MQNSQIEQDIETIEVSIEYAKKVVALGEAIDRLKANRDFQLVIGDTYQREEASRLTLLLGDPNITEQSKAGTITSLCAIGEFFQFLRARSFAAQQMAKELLDHQENLDTLRHIEAHGEDEAVTE